MKHVHIFTDGSCLGNPGPGGWAAILRLVGEDYEKEFSGGYAKTTNNRMEIMAVIEGLQALKFKCKVDIFSDSQYVCNAIEKKWLISWKKNNWRKSDKKPVKNQDLWQILSDELAKHQASFHWIRGHQGHTENERCDELARTEAAKNNLPEDTGFKPDEE